MTSAPTGQPTAETTGRPVPGQLGRWVAGARPRTLPAALVPVVVGTAAAHPYAQLVDGRGGPAGTGGPAAQLGRVLGALVVALAVQVGTNYANDYSDGTRGTDAARVGPLRLVGSGLASPGSVKTAALVSFGVAGVAGLALASVTSWWVVAVGAACLAAGWLYTGGPRPYGYLGLGEAFVFVFFGLVATEGTLYVETGRLSAGGPLAAAVAAGLLAAALLEANNLRDLAGDAAAGKRTLAVRLGRRRAGLLAAGCLAVPFVVVALWALVALPAAPSARAAAGPFLPLLAVPLAARPVRLATGGAAGRDLLPLLGATARLQLVVGVLLAAGLWLVVV